MGPWVAEVLPTIVPMLLVQPYNHLMLGNTRCWGVRGKGRVTLASDHQHQPASVTIKIGHFVAYGYWLTVPRLAVFWLTAFSSQHLASLQFGTAFGSQQPGSNSDHSVRFTVASQQFGSQRSLHSSLAAIRITALGWSSMVMRQ